MECGALKWGTIPIVPRSQARWESYPTSMARARYLLAVLAGADVAFRLSNRACKDLIVAEF
jgi:hypothetical protein